MPCLLELASNTDKSLNLLIEIFILDLFLHAVFSFDLELLAQGTYFWLKWAFMFNEILILHSTFVKSFLMQFV